MKLDDDTIWSIKDGHIPDIDSHAEEVSNNIPDFGRMVGLHWSSNELLSLLHWELGKSTVCLSKPSQ